jgi:hypothetical protein
MAERMIRTAYFYDYDDDFWMFQIADPDADEVYAQGSEASLDWCAVRAQKARKALEVLHMALAQVDK